MDSEEDTIYSSDNEETQVQYQPKISDASPRPRSSSKKGKSPGSARGSSLKGTPYGKSGKRPTASHQSDYSLSRSTAGSKTGSKKEHIKSPQQYYTETLRNTGSGFTDPGKRPSLSGLNKSQAHNMSFSSTSHFLRQKVGFEKNAMKTRPQSASNRPAGGGPAYKSQEEYYDDILELKKQIQALSNDNSQMKSRVRRLEEDNQKKEKEIEQLLDPSKSEEMRRTLADRKPDAGTVIHSMKQKILKLEQQLKEKESSFNKLQSDMKTTKVEELRIQMESFYAEVLRLQKLKSIDAPAYRNSGSSGKGDITGDSPKKMKALKDTILKMNEKNYKLESENKTLKQDLDKMLEKEGGKSNTGKHGNKSEKDLLRYISKLEKRLEKYDETTSMISDIDSRQAHVEGKVKLEGTPAQRLDQLDKRETELLEELNKSQQMCKKLKDDRAQYRNQVQEKDKEIERLHLKIEELEAELPGAKRSSSSRVTTASRSSTSPRDRRASKVSGGYDKRKVEEFRQKHAAKTIWKHYKGYRTGKDEREEEETAEMIQSYMRAHSSRKNQLKNKRRTHVSDDETSDTADKSDSVDQRTAYKDVLGASHRSSHSSKREKPSRVYDDTTGDSTEQTETDNDRPAPSYSSKRSSGRFTSLSNSGRTSPTRKSPAPSRRTPPLKRSNAAKDDDDSDDSDDLIMTSSSRGKKLF